MKEIYVSPQLDVLTVNTADIITTSPGVETPGEDLGFGNW